ncbi:MAG: N-acetyl-gamma-glutamyl-phosphate reductase [Lachnospiraceae bacterium]|nr:N-acetyl-gamma-glutamyl-phosphate reductase [Lachnospiraceae bacterium]
MIKAGVIGATGYAGEELVRILYSHPMVEIKYLGTKSYEGERFSKVYGNFFNIIDEECILEDLDKFAEDVDVIFTATPQGFLGSHLKEEMLSKVKIIDLSADYRIKDVDVYEKWYGIKHESPELIKKAVYGLSEINREDIRNTKLLANPGCYTTCSILTLYPIVKEGLIDINSIVIDAKSGTSGAGRGLKTANLFCEVNESIKPYGVGTHRHTPEIEEQLSFASGKEVKLIFTPNLIPMYRGILATCYGKVKDGVDENQIKKAYEKYYKDEHFIRLLDKGVYPETRWVKDSNYVDIGFKLDERTGNLVMIGAIDNLVKGAAGQAVQNMNIMFDFPETMGIDKVPNIL